MKRLLNFFARNPWWVVAVLLLLSLAAASQLGRVQVQVSADELLVRDDPQRHYFDEIRRRFGEEQVVLLYLEDERPLAPEKLTVFKRVLDELEALPFVERVESLFTVPYLKSVGGYLNQEPYLAELPATPVVEHHLTEEALINPFVRHTLLSTDGRVMAAALILAEGVADDRRISETLERLTAPLAGHYARVFPIGFPQVRSEIAERIRQEQGDLAPLALGALLIALFLLLRQAVDILAPVLTGGLSILFTLGVMGAAGIPLNVVTSIVPILLIVVGSTEDIHLISEFRHGQRTGLDHAQALRHMSRKLGRTVLLTFLTTFAGFLSVGLSRIEVLWQFGVLASAGLLLNFLTTIALIPALLSLAGRWRLDGRSRLFDGAHVARAARYWSWLERHRRQVTVVLVVVTLAAAAGIPALQVNHNAVDSLARDSGIRERVEAVNQRLAGLDSFSIVIDSGIQDTFLKVRYLEELEELQRFIEGQGLSRTTTSFADYLSLLNGAFQELERPTMPQSDDMVDELMIFLDHRRVAAFVSEDYSTARILVRHQVASTAELESFVAAVEGFIAENLDPGLRAHITGDSVLTLSATRAMIDGQLQSIALLLAFIVVLIGVLFTDLRVGLLAALPNALPVVVLFGVMGYAGIPLNIGTTMAAAIAIGIAVDDTMHFMLRYNQELGTTRHPSLAMHHTLFSEALPVFATSVALSAGFLVFALSSFEPIRQFGLLSALVIATALVADFVITPLAIASLRLVTLWDLLSLRLRRQVIGRSALFRGMRDWQIRKFILSSTLQEYAVGERVFRQGEPSEEIFLVMQGAVEVVLKRRCAEGGMVVDRFKTGDLFGEIALLAGEPRKADAVALEPTKLLVITREGIANATQRHPVIAARLFLNLSTDISRRWVRFIARAQECRQGEERGDEQNNDEADRDPARSEPGDAAADGHLGRGDRRA